MFCIAQLCSYIVRAYYVSQVKWYHSLNIISAVRETNLPWITKIRKPAERIVSNSFVVIMLWVQHALTCPSRPQLDCIPVEDMPLTHSHRVAKGMCFLPPQMIHQGQGVLRHNRRRVVGFVRGHGAGQQAQRRGGSARVLVGQVDFAAPPPPFFSTAARRVGGGPVAQADRRRGGLTGGSAARW